ncbi:MAG: hypothetical protein IT342_22825 [Candidatus Melainabacteria bacterium]|nr:hypothetical protein [Candidatus Melainabacteria bacterium]
MFEKVFSCVGSGKLAQGGYKFSIGGVNEFRMKDTKQKMRRIILRNLIPVIVLTIILLLVFWRNVLASSPMFFGYRGKDTFGIYTATPDGKNFEAVLLDERREMTHARVSPNGKRITFTRYNRVVKDGLCEENGSDYLNTEVVFANIDGTNQRSIEPGAPVTMSANSSWIDDDTLVYIHKANLKVLPELRTYRLSTGEHKRLPTPPQLAAADPTCVGTLIVFPIIPLDNVSPCALWAMKVDGSGLRQITKPNIKETSSQHSLKLGDYDPWLSPDARTVVFMRYFGGMDWRIFTVVLSDGKETLISKPGIPSGIPKWNGSGKAIAFVCWDNSKLENLGLYTVAGDGSNRKKIPLPAGYLYTHPSFFSESRLNAEEKLMFSARRVPGLPK